MQYAIQRTMQFKRDYKLAVKRGCNIAKLKKVISMLANGEPLPAVYKNHHLRGKPYDGYMECHVEPDWLLVYRLYESTLILSLYRTGTHSDLFG